MVKLCKAGLLGVLLALGVEGQAGQFDSPVLVNEAVGVTALTYDELFAIFTFKRTQWEGVKPITVVTRPLHSLSHNYFLTSNIKLGRLAYQRRVSSVLAGGRGKPPKIVTSNSEMIKTIGKIKGSIGYLDGIIYLNSENAPGVVMVEVDYEMEDGNVAE